jgi:Bifunctional DNA primase/polymerase, N-terminal
MKYPFDRPPTTAGRRSYRPAKLPEGEDVATLLDTALALIRKKIAVFPCQPQGKVPACGRGVLDATKDRNIVSHFWSLNPAYNIGAGWQAASMRACRLSPAPTTKASPRARGLIGTGRLSK